MYEITPYSFKQAKKNKLVIKPSTNSKYKIDVYDTNDNFLAHIGSPNYSDYPTYIKTHGLEYANERRRLYYIRHEKDNKIKGILAKIILW